MNGNVVKYTVEKFTVNCRSKRGAWMTLYQLSIFLLPEVQTLPTPLNGPTLMVWGYFFSLIDYTNHIVGLLRVLDDLEQASRNGNDPEALSAVRECRTGLEKLVLKMDSLESGFDRIAERSRASVSLKKFLGFNI